MSEVVYSIIDIKFISFHPFSVGWIELSFLPSAEICNSEYRENYYRRHVFLLFLDLHLT